MNLGAVQPDLQDFPSSPLPIDIFSVSLATPITKHRHFFVLKQMRQCRQEI